MEAILIFLAAYSCFPTAVVTMSPTDQTYYKNEVIYLAPQHLEQDNVLVHEFVHSCQYTWLDGSATNYREWRRREIEAIGITDQWINR